jgi:hypothetical protein
MRSGSTQSKSNRLLQIENNAANKVDMEEMGITAYMSGRERGFTFWKSSCGR